MIEGGEGTPRGVAIIGSSGGGGATLGRGDPAGFLSVIEQQLQAAGMEVAAVQYVWSATSLDQAGPHAQAALWCHDGERPVIRLTGPLGRVNAEAEGVDIDLAHHIRSGRIQGIVLVSADIHGVNRRALEAAADQALPAVGTGGTSVAAAKSLGVRFVGASGGSVATTNRTRAVAYAAGLARHFGSRYRPALGVGAEPGGLLKGVHSILDGTLPAFIVMALVLAASNLTGLQAMEDLLDRILTALPVVVAAIAAKQISGLDDVGIIAGIIAGVLALNGGILAGMLVGIAAGALCPRLLSLAYGLRTPATAATILSTGLAGLVPGALAMLGLAEATAWISEGYRSVLAAALGQFGLFLGAAVGLAIWPSIMFGGLYHAVVLPLILLEMEAYGNSFLGAVDLAGLCLGCAGITGANLVAPRRREDRESSKAGFSINLGWGDFVEAGYPLMKTDRWVMAAVVLSSGVGGAVLGAASARSTAYMPFPVGIAASNRPSAVAVALACVFLGTFTVTVLRNLWVRRTGEQPSPVISA